MARIDAFLKLGVAQGCSDLHLAVGVPPMLRLHGDLVPIKFRDLGDAELESYITEVLTQSQLKTLREGHDLDFSYVSADGGRFRVNVFRKETGIGAAFRAIPTLMPSIDVLGLPPIVKKLCDHHQGMILVTGSTGTGKTTTLASMIDYLNATPQPQHHQPRGSDRIRSSQQIEPGHPARARHPSALLRRGGPRRDARGSGRDPGRRNARCGDHIHGHDGRRDRPPGARHPAHHERHQDHRPHHRRPAGRGARADQELPGLEPDRRHHAGPAEDARPARTPRRLRGHGADQGDRQAHHDRSIAPDPEPAADGQRIRHAAARPGAARRNPGEGGGPRAGLPLRERQAAIPALRHRHERRAAARTERH